MRKSAFKLKPLLRWILSKNLLMSAVISKQRLLNKNEVVQYLQN